MDDIGYLNDPCIDCGTDCADVIAVPPVQSNRCIKTWDIRKSEGRTIYIAEIPKGGKVDPPLTDMQMQLMCEDPTILSDLVDNIGDGGIRCICGIWDMPEPEEEVISFKGETCVTKTTYTLNFETIDSNDVNYEFARRISKCPIKACIAFDNDGGSFYGWAVATISASFPINRGSDSVETIKLTAKWCADCLPPRYKSPGAIDVTCEECEPPTFTVNCTACDMYVDKTDGGCGYVFTWYDDQGNVVNNGLYFSDPPTGAYVITATAEGCDTVTETFKFSKTDAGPNITGQTELI